MKLEEICQALTKEIPSEQVYCNEPMSKHITFKVGGNADIFVKVRSIPELKSVIKVAKKHNIHLTIIGNGSNVLVKDKGIRGIVVKIEIDTIEIEPQEDKMASGEKKEVIVTAGAGVVLARLAQELLKQHITGLEFASGIPGTVGGAIKMNAGAYGKEMQDVVVSTKCLDLKRYDMLVERTNIDDIEITEIVKKADEPEMVELTNAEQEFSYRHSIFSERRYIILETKLKLQYGKEEEIRKQMDELASNRKEKQPNLPSAGSTFKRGEDFITAKLIDECGLKGKQIGGAQVSEKHAGFIVNTGEATAQDILDLIAEVKKTVYQKTGKSIDLEIEVLGE